ncbi:hypothetical protein BKA56DRAFT_202435 [Ilyonectria sp. MPI-CAGE-AT-0026]|nr:hypothetical protein BKA56DRAFT_202435 [Ilyonectria sp. MPI-CAGE-AT-0026]
MLNSNSFQDLLTYYNKASPIINRDKIKGILLDTFNNSLLQLNKQLEENISTFGTFSLTFDIWTSKTQIAYLGIILIFIDKDFNLIYKLMGFNQLIESHTGLYIYKEFKNSLIPYPAIQDNTIFRILLLEIMQQIIIHLFLYLRIIYLQIRK